MFHQLEVFLDIRCGTKLLVYCWDKIVVVAT